MKGSTETSLSSQMESIDRDIVGMSDVRIQQKCTGEKGKTKFQERGSVWKRTPSPSSYVHVSL